MPRLEPLAARRPAPSAPARNGGRSRAAGSGRLPSLLLDDDQRLVDQPREHVELAARRRPRPRRGRSCRRRRRAGGTASRSSSSSSSWLQSSVARERLLARRAPVRPTGCEHGSESRRRSAICAGASTPTRAAASSIASGMPSSRRQISATAAAFSSSDELANARRDARRPARANSSARGSPVGSDSDGTRQSTSPAMCSGSRLVASTRRFGQARSSALGEPRAGADQVLAVVEHEQQCAARRCAPPAPPPTVGPSGSRRPAPRHRVRHQRRVGEPGQLDEPHAVVGVVAPQRGGRLERQARLAAAAGPGERHQAVSASSPITSPSSRSRPTKLVSCSGRLPAPRGGRSARRGGPPTRRRVLGRPDSRARIS